MVDIAAVGVTIIGRSEIRYFGYSVSCCEIWLHGCHCNHSMLYYGTETGSSALFLTERERERERERVWKVSKTCGAEYQCGFSKMRRGKKKPKRRSSVIKSREGKQ